MLLISRLDGIKIGDLIYDTYIKSKRKPTVIFR